MLKVEEVGFSYGQNLILNQITFDVMPGEMVGIVGISGSGKSTLGRLILQEMAPNQGRIESTYESVLPIFQHATYAFNPKLTIQDSLNEAAQYQQRTDKEIKVYRDELMSQMELPKHLLSHYPNDVSGGQLQRFNVIRTLMLKPDLLICDEVTANLDVVAEAKMARQLKRYAEESGKTMIIISHDIAFLQSIVNRIIVLHEGQLVDDFLISELFEVARHPATQDLLRIYMDMM